MVWQYQSTSIVIYILAIGLSSIYLYTLVNGWHCNNFSSVHTCTFIQRELIFTRLVFLTKNVKIIILRKTWVYILTCSLNSLVLHIVLHITSTESFWHYCYRRPTFLFHKPHSPSIVNLLLLVRVNSFISIVIELQSLLCSRVSLAEILCNTMVIFRSASTGANQAIESTKRYKK